eukprot:PITA_15288
MGSHLLLQAFVLAALLPVIAYGKCDFPAIFNFGDSNSDTGGWHFAFPYQMLPDNAPYGKTYFGSPSYRYSDGRLAIDFFAQSLGLPFLSPFLQSVGSRFEHGANFAASGAAVRTSTDFNAPISLTVQLNEFKVFKQQVLDTISSHGNLNYLPSADAFTKGIYTIEIGGNDFDNAYRTQKLSPVQVKQSILPKLAKSVAAAVQDLSSTGAKTVLVKNIGPQGCGPFWLSYFSHAPSDFDKYGCSISYNDAVKFYNTQLQEELALVRKQLPGTDIVYVNQYDIIYDFFANPSTYGFKATTQACCGVGGKYNFTWSAQCGLSGPVNGKTVTVGSCSDPASYIIWDGIHLTDQANRLLTKQILTGKYFDPPSFSISNRCQIQPI